MVETFENTKIIPDFLIKFANYNKLYQNLLQPKLFKFLNKYVNDRYENKKITMNCWQFILLCLLESGYITVEHILKLYQNLAFDEQTNKDIRIPDYFNMEKNEHGKIGDIILYWF